MLNTAAWAAVAVTYGSFGNKTAALMAWAAMVIVLVLANREQERSSDEQDS